MATRLKPIGHEDRLSLVEHLDELRTRIIICLARVRRSCFGVCLWQDDAILDIDQPAARPDGVNASPATRRRDPLEQADCWQQAQQRVNEQIAASARRARAPPADDASRELQAQAEELARAAEAAAAATPRGIAEAPGDAGRGRAVHRDADAWRPTRRCCSRCPLLLYQAVRVRAAGVLADGAPGRAAADARWCRSCSIAGVVFAYFLVLPAAVNFLQNFNDDNYDILLQARDYYKFAVMVLARRWGCCSSCRS